MLRRKRIMALLSTTMIFNSFNNALTPFLPVATEVVNNNEVVFQTNKLGMIKTDFEVQIEKDKIKFEKQKMEERLRKEKEQKKNEPEWQEYILTFYTSLSCENSSAGAVTSQGRKLSRGGVANNIIPQNTKIYLDRWGEVTVNDKGSNKHFSVDNRLDVFVEREAGESDSQYLRRVNSYGVQRVKGYIIK